MEQNNIFFILEYLKQNWIGIAISIYLGIYFYRKSKKVAEPVVTFLHTRIISKRKADIQDDIEILYKGEQVECVSKTNILFWNNGTRTIHGENIVETSPIMFEFSAETTILRCQIIKNTRNEIKARTKINSENQNIIFLNFDYLDPKDGVNIEVLHNGELDNPRIHGTIREIPQGIILVNDLTKFGLLKTITLTVLTLSSMVIICLGVLELLEIPKIFSQNIEKLSVFFSNLLGIQINQAWALLIDGTLIGTVSYILLKAWKTPCPRSLIEINND